MTTVKDDLKPRGQKRASIDTKVNLEFERFSGFISEYASNISEGGMFIKTNSPQPVGSVFSFEFRLRDAVKLIQGWGEVAWIREAKDAVAGKDAGMGVKFMDLDQESRNLIRRIVNTEKGSMANNQGKSGIEDILNDASLFEEESLDANSTTFIEAQAETHPETQVLTAGNANVADSNALVQELDSNPTDEGSLQDLKIDDIVGDESGYAEEKSRLGTWVTLILLLALGGGGYYFRPLWLPQATAKLVALGVPVPWAKTTTTAESAAKPLPPSAQREAAPAPAPEQAASATSAPAATAPVAAAPAATAAYVPPPAPAAPILKPAQLIRGVILVKSDATASVFEIALDGGIDPAKVALFRADAPPPRMVLDIPGITKKYPKASLEMKDKRVQRLRFGLHPDKMRIVFDLSKTYNGASEFAVQGNKLLVTLRQ